MQQYLQKVINFEQKMKKYLHYENFFIYNKKERFIIKNNSGKII